MVNKMLRFTWDEWKWIAIIVMLGVVMYWTALVIEPTYTLIREAQETQDFIIDQGDQAIEQNQRIIDNQNNNTARLENIILKQKQLADNQLNLTQGLGDAANTITNQSNLLVGQGDDIQKIVLFFRTHFNETFLEGEGIERETTQDILGNVTQIRNLLLLRDVGVNQTIVDMLIEKEMRKWIGEVKQNLSDFS